MSEEQEVDLEDERTKNYELGKVSILESLGPDLRKRAGEIYAHANSRKEHAKAKQLKELAREYEERAEEAREEWNNKWKDG